MFKTYINLFKSGHISTGFSPRIPDYATKYWLNQLEKASQKNSKNNFLDIGAGEGRLTVILANSGFKQGTAIEILVNKNHWNKILNKFENIKLKEGLLQEIVGTLETKEKFDFVMLSEVFEHIPPKDVPDFLSALKRVVSDNGKVFLTTPNSKVQGPAEQSHIWYEIFPYGHHKHYNYLELKELLFNHGFEVEWHAFECNKIKEKVYNKFFYPTARLDQKLLTTKKLPVFIRNIYKFWSYPFILLTRSIFWFLAKFITKYETKHNNENNAATMMLLLKKSK